MEPYWESKFEGSSYGFRPGRSTHDAIGKIYLIARPNKNKKWVVDGCLGLVSINHVRNNRRFFALMKGKNPFANLSICYRKAFILT
ncbi:hypothetical protein [Nostoc sp.]|uniref:hypothetical protein n=1 Tax=Nostoc sp. TaxID=1180 RepID=UPI003FA58EEB